jgi:hypothetical protein
MLFGDALLSTFAGGGTGLLAGGNLAGAVGSGVAFAGRLGSGAVFTGGAGLAGVGGSGAVAFVSAFTSGLTGEVGGDAEGVPFACTCGAGTVAAGAGSVGRVGIGGGGGAEKNKMLAK